MSSPDTQPRIRVGRLREVYVANMGPHSLDMIVLRE
jgi:hypothetical protein